MSKKGININDKIKDEDGRKEIMKCMCIELYRLVVFLDLHFIILKLFIIALKSKFLFV